MSDQAFMAIDNFIYIAGPHVNSELTQQARRELSEARELKEKLERKAEEYIIYAQRKLEQIIKEREYAEKRAMEAEEKLDQARELLRRTVNCENFPGDEEQIVLCADIKHALKTDN